MQEAFHEDRTGARNLLARVRCDGCGASTPVIDVSEPKCAYCGSRVQLAAELQSRSQAHAQTLFDARSAGVARVYALEIRGRTRALIIAALMAASSLCLVGLWHRIAIDRGFVASPWDLVNTVVILLAPATFFFIARHLAVDAALRELTGLSIARLEEQPNDLGVIRLRLACGACGSLLSNAVVHGLSVTCDACHTPSLAPSAVVAASEQKFYRRIRALRDAFDADLSRIPWAPLLVGGSYLLTCLAFLSQHRDFAVDYALGSSCATLENLALALAGVLILAGEENLWFRSLMAIMLTAPPFFICVMMFLEQCR